MARGETLLEGSYSYISGTDQYCQENFKFIQNLETQAYQVQAEILSRIESGEFLKILVTMDLNQTMLPIQSKTERFLGKHYTQEIFRLDTSAHELHYSFQTAEGIEEHSSPFNLKHFLTSPAFSTSCFFLLNKKLDATGRTPVTLVSTENAWSYQGPPQEKIVFAEYKSHEAGPVTIHGNELVATQVSFYEQDASGPDTDLPANFTISKYFSIPYQMVQGKEKIVIDQLKKHF